MHILIMLIIFFSTINLKADNLKDAMSIAAAAMEAQSARLKIISQNIANVDSTAIDSTNKPYRRQVVTFKHVKSKLMDSESKRLIVKSIVKDRSAFRKIYEPAHPAADADGYVEYPNINITLEQADASDAMRSYEGNLNTYDLTKSMYNRTIDILK